MVPFLVVDSARRTFMERALVWAVNIFSTELHAWNDVDDPAIWARMSLPTEVKMNPRANHSSY